MMLRLRLTQSRLRQATRLKLFEHERAGIYAREVRKASFNASQNGAPTKSVDFVGKRRSDGVNGVAIPTAKGHFRRDAYCKAASAHASGLLRRLPALPDF